MDIMRQSRFIAMVSGSANNIFNHVQASEGNGERINGYKRKVSSFLPPPPPMLFTKKNQYNAIPII